MDAGRTAALEAAHRELETIYRRVTHEPWSIDGDRLLDAERVIVSQPADSLTGIIVRARALIAMRAAEGAADETLLTGLHTLLDDLIRLGSRNPEL